MEIKTTTFKEWDYWYDEQCTEKKTKVKMAMKQYKKRNYEVSTSRYCSFKKEYVHLLEDEKKDGRKRNQKRRFD